MNDIIKKNRLLNACINNNGDIFDEIKKLRKAPPTVPTMIDGVSYKIESHFATVQLNRRRPQPDSCSRTSK